MAAPTALALRDVHKSYREGEAEREVLRGVELSLARGELVVLVGRSGSGKSTLLNLVSGIDVPTRGQVEVQGERLDVLDERARTLLRRRRVGFIFQSFNLLPTLTVEENVRLPLELLGRPAAEARARAHALLARVGLGGRADSFPARLSGDSTVAYALGFAQAVEAALLLADEPTGNLDEETGARVLALLEELVHTEGSAALVVTHDPDVAARADRVVALEGGRLVERRR